MKMKPNLVLNETTIFKFLMKMMRIGSSRDSKNQCSIISWFIRFFKFEIFFKIKKKKTHFLLMLKFYITYLDDNWVIQVGY